MKRLSVVIPVYNEEEVLPRLFAALTGAFSNLPDLDFEAVLVNDGSRDRSWNLICEQNRCDPRFRGVNLSRNFGHQLALTAGLDHATGDAIVAMDADLQDSPAVVLQMVERWKAGHDVVYGQRRTREGESRFKLLTAKGFYRLMKVLSRDRTPYEVGDFYLLSRRALEKLRAMREHNGYLRGMIFWLGFEPVAVLYDRESRKAGQTKFSVRKMLRFALDGIVSSSTTPLYMAAYLGFGSALFGLLLTVYAVIARIVEPEVVRGWASTVIIVLFLGGIQLVTIGILGLYIARIYDEVRGRPLYVVQDAHSSPGGESTSRPDADLLEPART